MERCVDVLHRLGREALVGLGAVERLHVGGGQGGELGLAERRAEVKAYEGLVGLVGVGANASPHGVLEPPREVLPDGEAPGVVGEATVAVGYGLRQLPAGLLVALSVDYLALASGGGLDSVAGHPGAVLAPGDPARAVSLHPRGTRKPTFIAP